MNKYLTKGHTLSILLLTMSEVISIKVDSVTKREAKYAASELGLSLSAVLKGLLKQFIRTKTVTFSPVEEKPSKYLLELVRKAREDRKAGKASPSFDNAKDTIAWLHKDA